MSVFRALKHLPFALLWSGQTISRFGDSFYTVALAWWVLQKTHSAAAMGLVLACSSVPMLVLLLPGGVLVDRLPRLLIMLCSDLVRAAIVGLIAFLALSGRLEIWHLLVMSALFGSVQAFFYPAYTALLPDMVPRADLPSANSLRSISLQLAGVLGPALAGLVVVTGGSWLAFALDGLSFVLSTACLLALRPAQMVASPKRESTNALQDLLLGLQTVLQSPWLWITIAIAGLSNITLSGPFEAVLPLLVVQHLRASAQTYGALMTCYSVGSLLAAFWLGRSKSLRHRGYLAYGAWIAISLLLAWMGVLSSVVGMGLVICLWGAGMALLNLVWAHTLQECVPLERLGRVASIDALGSYALLPIGYALSGFVADCLGASTVFLFGGLLSAGVIALGLAHPAVHKMD